MPDAGTVSGMASRKVTVTLAVEQVDAIRRLVADGAAPSVSGFVQNAVEVSLDDVTDWDAILAEALATTGGELTAEERRWADRILQGGARAGDEG